MRSLRGGDVVRIKLMAGERPSSSILTDISALLEAQAWKNPGGEAPDIGETCTDYGHVDFEKCPAVRCRLVICKGNE